MQLNFKPMLASQIDDLSSVKYPVYASYKLDGIRAIIHQGVAYSRSLKPIPNKSIQEWAMQNKESLEGLDGEFIVGEPNTEEVFRETTSFVMSHDKVGEFSFYVFDILPAYPEQPYNAEGSPADRRPSGARKGALEGLSLPGNTKVLQQTLIASKDDLEAFRSNAVEQGYEGAMIKAPEGKYKYGRSSVKEGLLLKLKLFKDEEFKIVGFECKYHNANEAKTNELGRTARSTSKEGMIPVDTLGVLYLSTKDGVEFGCGSGFDDATRKELWEQRESLVGKYATVKYFDQGGYDVPRFPVFKSLRDPMDFKE